MIWVGFGFALEFGVWSLDIHIICSALQDIRMHFHNVDLDMDLELVVHSSKINGIHDYSSFVNQKLH